MLGCPHMKITITDIKTAHPAMQIELFFRYCSQQIISGKSYDGDYEDPKLTQKQVISSIASCGAIAQLKAHALAAYIITTASDALRRSVYGGAFEHLSELVWRAQRESDDLHCEVTVNVYRQDKQGAVVKGESSIIEIMPTGWWRIHAASSKTHKFIVGTIGGLEPKGLTNTVLLANAMCAAFKSAEAQPSLIVSAERDHPYMMNGNERDYVGWTHSPNAFCEARTNYLGYPLTTAEFNHVESLYEGLSAQQKVKFRKVLALSVETTEQEQFLGEIDREDFYEAYFIASHAS